MADKAGQISFQKIRDARTSEREETASPPPPADTASALRIPRAPSPPPPAELHAEERDPDALQLRHILEVLRRHLYLIAFVTILFPLCTVVYDTVLNRKDVPAEFRIGPARIYVSEAEFEPVTAVSNLSVDALGISLALPDKQQELSVEAQVKRPGFLQTLNEAFLSSLSDRAEGKERARIEALVRQFIEQMEQHGESQVASFTVRRMGDQRHVARFRGEHPALLQAMAESFVPALNAYRRRFRSRRVAAMRAQLDSAKGDMRTALQQEMNNLQKINETIAALARKPESDSGMHEKYTALRWEVMSLDVELEHLRKRYDYPSLAGRYGIANREDLRKVIAPNPLKDELRKLQFELADARVELTDAHPAIKKMREDIGVVRAALKAQGAATSSGEVPPLPSPEDLEALRQIARTEEKLELTRRMIGELEKQLPDPPAREASNGELERLRNERMILRKQMDEYATSLSRIQSRIADLDVSMRRPVDEDAYVQVRLQGAPRVIHPRVSLRAALALLAGLVVSASIAFLLEHMDNRLHTPGDISLHLRIAFLGIVPMWKKNAPRILSPETPDSLLGEAFAHICNNLRYASADNPEKRLLIASAEQREGKSHVAANVALRFASEGSRVLLIDTDLRFGRLHATFRPFLSEPNPGPGLSDYLCGEAALEDTILSTSLPELDLLPAGTRARNTVRLLGTPRMEGLLAWAEQRYEVVIVDSPAVLPVVDASVVAPMMNGVLLVIAAHEVTVNALKMAKYRLDHINAPILGCVLNKVKIARYAYSYHGYQPYADTQTV